MNSQELEPEADALLRAGKKVQDSLSDIPALYSIAISMKRIADGLDKIIEIECDIPDPEKN